MAAEKPGELLTTAHTEAGALAEHVSSSQGLKQATSDMGVGGWPTSAAVEHTEVAKLMAES